MGSTAEAAQELCYNNHNHIVEEDGHLPGGIDSLDV
jgi:hypothetical protein